MIISEMFTSIDGEARRAGELALFIRSIGCNLRCKYCDSVYTFQADESTKNMPVDEIVNKCKEEGIRNITFTGGEPLLQKDSDELIEALANNGFDVSIETNGSIDFSERSWFKNNTPNVWVCADYKMNFSGMSNNMLDLEKFAQLRSQDVLKMVVAESDLPQALNIINTVRNLGSKCFIYLSPVFGEIEASKIVDFMKENNLQDKIRVQLQMHKYIWDPKKRGV